LPSSTSAAPSGTPSPAINPGTLDGLPVTKVDFSCRLPVVTSSAGTTLQGGFISFPEAQLAVDAAGTMRRTVDGDFATTATPVLHGDGVVPFYDRAKSRWVPARARQARADGSAYAYMTWNPQTAVFTSHVVNVASGSSQSFALSAPSDPEIADYGAAGIYIDSASVLGGPGEEVWLLNPQTGAINQLRHFHRVWAVRNGYAWVARFDSRDKTVWPPIEVAPANSLVRIDLASGAETVWFYRAGSYPWLLGLDSFHRPVVLLGGTPTGNEIRLIDHPGSSGAVVYAGNTSGLDYLQGDRDRLWFGTARGIYLYRLSAGFQRVFAYDADPATSDRIEPAGFCV
jgi:hypothetical protein